MNQRLVWGPLLLLLGGCPAEAPGAGSFATDTGGNAFDGAIVDSGADAVDGSGATDGGSTPVDNKDGAAAADGGSAGQDATKADSAAPPKGACSDGALGWYTKSLVAPQYERVRDMVAIKNGAALAGDIGSGFDKTDGYLLGVSASGNKLWQRSYGGDKEDRIEGVIAFGDGFALAGMTRSSGAGNADGWLIVTDNKGKEKWAKTYGGEKTDELYSVAKGPNGGLVAAGLNRSLKGSQEKGWLLATDSKGEPLWEFPYGGSHIDIFYDLVATADGYTATGENWSHSSSGSDAWLLQVDKKGKQTRSKVYGKGDKDWARAIVAMGDGGFAMTGKASVKGNPKLWVIRTDDQGNVLWDSIQGANQSEQGWGIDVYADGGLVIAGDTNSGGFGVDAWLLRFDPWGNLMWQFKNEEQGNQWGDAVLALADGGAWLGGRAWSSDSQSDMYLVRAGPWGHGSCKLVGTCGDLAPDACDDGQACTIDVCDSVDGCTNTALDNGKICGDGMTCSASGKCQ